MLQKMADKLISKKVNNRQFIIQVSNKNTDNFLKIAHMIFSSSIVH